MFTKSEENANNDNNNNHDADDDNNNDDDDDNYDEHSDADSDDRRYCYCQLKWDGATPMLECDGCGEWYHFVCAMLDPNVEHDLWYCDSCEDTKGKGYRLLLFCLYYSCFVLFYFYFWVENSRALLCSQFFFFSFLIC